MEKTPALDEALKASDALTVAINDFEQQLDAFASPFVPQAALRPVLVRMKAAHERLAAAMMSLGRPD